jgi:DNA-binding response OmpR family regulator
MRVLVVEETSSWRRLSAAVWALEGIAADVALDGEQALVRAGATRYDLVVLDVMLPDGDGFVVCRRLREHGACAGVLMLTARNTIEDRVHGLDSGADDYLGKPFSFAELLARVRALRRRTTIERPVVPFRARANSNATGPRREEARASPRRCGPRALAIAPRAADRRATDRETCGWSSPSRSGDRD